MQKKKQKYFELSGKYGLTFACIIIIPTYTKQDSSAKGGDVQSWLTTTFSQNNEYSRSCAPQPTSGNLKLGTKH